jgi:HK97 family phage major capsid protein
MDPRVNEAVVKALKEIVPGAVADAVAEQMELNHQRRSAIADMVGQRLHEYKRPAPTKGAKLARCVQYLYQGGCDPDKALKIAHENNDGEFAEEWEHYRNLGRQFASISRAMGQDTIAGGGALVPPGFVTDFVEELQAEAVVRSLGLDVMPMRGSLSIPYLDTPPSAYYVGEAANATESSVTTGQLTLSERKLVVLSAMSNEWLANSSPQGERAVRDSMVRAQAAKEDITFIEGLGSSTAPKGMLYWVIAANKFNANATVNQQNVTNDLAKAINKLMAANVPLQGCGWIISPRTHLYLTSLITANGVKVWGDEMARGTLMGYPWRVSTQIAENLGGATNETKVYFANFSRGVVLGESANMEIEVFPNATFYDGASVVSGVSTYQSAARVVSRHDFGSRYRGKDIAVIEAVKWGV